MTHTLYSLLIIHDNLKQANSHLFSQTLKNHITYHKNEILDGDEINHKFIYPLNKNQCVFFLLSEFTGKKYSYQVFKKTETMHAFIFKLAPQPFY